MNNLTFPWMPSTPIASDRGGNKDMNNLTFTHVPGFWYMPTRENLDASVRDAQYFNTFEELCSHIRESVGLQGRRLESQTDIFVSAQSVIDDRIGAKIHYCAFLETGFKIPLCFGRLFQDVDLDVWNACRDKVLTADCLRCKAKEGADDGDWLGRWK